MKIPMRWARAVSFARAAAAAVWTAVGLAALAAPAPARAAGELKVGVGRRVITPPGDMWLAGYAARKAPSSGKLHDIYAKALAFEDETGGRFVILTTDLVGVTRSLRARAAELIQAANGLPADRLMLTASHTHSGPVIRENLEGMYPLDEAQDRLVTEYTEALPAKLAEAAGEALGSLEPCRVEWGHGSANFAVNRRAYAPTGTGLGVNPIGPVAHDVPVLFALRADGSVKAALFGYACHNTTLDGPQICGDYAGFAQAFIEDALPGALALFVSGCGGDVNPNPRGTVALARRHGLELAGAVVGALGARLAPARGPLRPAFAEVPLALSEPPTREALQKQADDPNIYVQRRAARLLARLDAEGSLPRDYPYPEQTLRFAEGPTLVALGGEVVVDYALRLKNELGPSSTFVIGYANDVMAYIPSLRILREGGYEGGDAMLYYGLHGPWAPGVEETIISTVHRLIGE